ncbi:MAG: hypothetical protein ACOC44_13065 [Promethearchaeia archaeon]
MEVSVDVPVGSVEEENKKVHESTFEEEFAKGYFWAELNEKQERLDEYMDEYNQMDDKSSYKGQYLATLMANLNAEVKKLKKQV